MHHRDRLVPPVVRRGLGLVALLIMVGCHGGFDGTPAGSTAIPVTVASAMTRDLVIEIQVLGSVVPLQQVLIKARVDGLIQEMPVPEGTEVAAGALVAQLDARPYRAARLQQEALAAKDQALLDQARLELTRYGTLAKGGMASQDSLELARTQVTSLSASLDADHALLAAVQLQEDFTGVRAPFSGRLGLRLVDPGAIVHATDALGLFTLSQVAPMSVLCSVPQDEFPRVRAVLAGGAPVLVEVRSRTLDHLADGVLKAVDNHVDAASGQIQVRVVCGNQDRALWPGTFVSVRIPVGTVHAVAVPSSALEKSEAGWTVLVVTGTVAQVRAVQVGAASHGWTQIVGGLAVGERVITGGQYRVADGDQVACHDWVATALAP